jgi:hypothetical protein
MWSGKGLSPKDETDVSFRRESGILVTFHPSAIVENGVEEVILPLQLGLTFLTDLDVHLPPHLGDDDDFMESIVAAELPEHLKVPFSIFRQS